MHKQVLSLFQVDKQPLREDHGWNKQHFRQHYIT